MTKATGRQRCSYFRRFALCLPGGSLRLWALLPEPWCKNATVMAIVLSYGTQPRIRVKVDERSLTERDICTKFIMPALKSAGWDEMLQIREEVYFTNGRIIVRGKLVSRGKAKKADFVLYYKPNIPIALIEAKDNNHSVGDGMQQGLEYATTLDVPFVFSSNGDGFVFYDRTGANAQPEVNLGLDAFPSPPDLWARYSAWKGFTAEAQQIVLQDYFGDPSGKAPRYYQVNAVNTAIEKIAKGQDRILLVMATGTGKTYTAFQSSGAYGRPDARSASSIWPTGTS